MAKPILCLDFDGVMHSYSSGWQGADVITDPPVPGLVTFLGDAAKHFRIAVFSSRSGQSGGIQAMQAWLANVMSHELRKVEPGSETANVWKRIYDEIEWPIEKPPAFLTIDDRAITFTGEWPNVDALRSFKPWNNPGGTLAKLYAVPLSPNVGEVVLVKNHGAEPITVYHPDGTREVVQPEPRDGEVKD